MICNSIIASTVAVAPAGNFDSFMIIGVVLGVTFLFGLSKYTERRNRRA